MFVPIPLTVQLKKSISSFIKGPVTQKMMKPDPNWNESKPASEPYPCDCWL